MKLQMHASLLLQGRMCQQTEKCEGSHNFNQILWVVEHRRLGSAGLGKLPKVTQRNFHIDSTLQLFCPHTHVCGMFFA